MSHSDLIEAPSLNTLEFLDNPYPAYAWLRRNAPVYFSQEWNAYLITRYSDVTTGFRDPRLLSNRNSAYEERMTAAQREWLRPLVRNISRWMMFTDPPDHTRLRGLVNRAFAPRLMETMRPRIQAAVEALLKDVLTSEGHELDVVEALAAPLPVLVMGEIMGLPKSDLQILKPWAHALLVVMGARQVTPEGLAAGLAAIGELEKYFRDLLAQRRRSPTRREDLLTGLLEAQEQGSILDEQELLSTCAMILFGGHETAINLIANAIWLLARHPQEQSMLRANPAAIPQAIEEMLRIESPFQRMGRLAGEDLVLHGQTIRKGQIVALVIGAANRDETQFANPDMLDIQRTDNRHLAFGYGSHFCVGVTLGRLEGQLAIEGLLRALPRFSLGTEPPTRLDHLNARGFKRLYLQKQ